MEITNRSLSRRSFVNGLAALLGYAGARPASVFGAQSATPSARSRRPEPTVAEYDAFAKLSSNENPYGPFESVMEAMTEAFKYANRYGYPDGGITEEIAAHHGVEPENILLGSGSGEILKVVAATFLSTDRKVLGVEPTFGSVYQHAAGIKADAIRLPLLEDFRQDMRAMIGAVKSNYREIGFVYLCNPNNPTGLIVTKEEVRELLDGIPEDVPVLVDEAYHHFIDDPSYATAVPYVIEGRPVIVARTFSKIAALAGMRLGYAIAPKEIVARMESNTTGSVNALVKWGAVAALKDTASQEKVKKVNREIRDKATGELESLGYGVIPSQTNFFMVHVRRPVQPVIEEFRERGVLVGRPFPPMLEHLRVSVGTPDEMRRFMEAFKEIFASGKGPTA